jgi:hypothetical protein
MMVNLFNKAVDKAWVVFQSMRQMRSAIYQGRSLAHLLMAVTVVRLQVLVLPRDFLRWVGLLLSAVWEAWVVGRQAQILVLLQIVKIALDFPVRLAIRSSLPWEIYNLLASVVE